MEGFVKRGHLRVDFVYCAFLMFWSLCKTVKWWRDARALVRQANREIVWIEKVQKRRHQKQKKRTYIPACPLAFESLSYNFKFPQATILFFFPRRFPVFSLSLYQIFFLSTRLLQNRASGRWEYRFISRNCRTDFYFPFQANVNSAWFWKI